MHTCGMCESTNNLIKYEKRSFSYKGNLLSYDSNYIECRECGFKYVPYSFKKDIELLKCDMKREVDGLLTSSQIKQIREKLNITQKYASTLLGGGPNSFSKYERGEVIQSRPMDMLIRLIEINPNNVELLNEISSIRDDLDTTKSRIKPPVSSGGFNFDITRSIIIDTVNRDYFFVYEHQESKKPTESVNPIVSDQVAFQSLGEGNVYH